MVAAYYMEVRCEPVARRRSCRRCRHNKFQVVPGITLPVEFEMEKEEPRAVECPLFQGRTVPVKSYHGAQDITTGKDSARDYTNELVDFWKI